MSLSYHTITTPRLTTAYLSAGTPGKPRLLLLHGNVSSAVFYEHLMERLADDFEMLAPDFRCFGHSSALPIDATRGMRDFSDDIAEFLHAVGWDRFHLFGWSMGGGVAMQYAIDHPRQVQSLILQAPLSPFGFGGSYGEVGAPVEPAQTKPCCKLSSPVTALCPVRSLTVCMWPPGISSRKRSGKNTLTLYSCARREMICARVTAFPAPNGHTLRAAPRACPTQCPCNTATFPPWRMYSPKCLFCGFEATRM